jgi:glutamyl-tRNA reductase
MISKFHVVGINHRSAPLLLREKVAAAVMDHALLFAQIRSIYPDVELTLLSTCNRTELYFADSSATVDLNEIRDLLLAPLTPAERLSFSYVKRGASAVRHLFRVAAGLDSMVVGETEILGQIKHAFAAAQERGTTGRTLSRLFRDATGTARQVHRETALSRGRVSVSSLAVQFAEQLFNNLPVRAVMIIGAGTAAEGALKSLKERGVREIMIANRSAERGVRLSQSLGGKVIALKEIEQWLPQMDVVLSSTGSSQILLDLPMITRVMKLRPAKPLLLLDLAVPRDIEQSAEQVANVHLYDMDALRGIAAQNREQRKAAIKEARAIVSSGITDCLRQFKN